jgi:adenylylsulfate kinase-like enzyme
MLGQLIWIAGVIWSRKTTLANELTAHLQQSSLQPILFNGDILRKLLKTSQITVDAHNRKSRIKLALKYAQMYELLSYQGFKVVIATISMFGEVYA